MGDVKPELETEDIVGICPVEKTGGERASGKYVRKQT